ncbi:4Fe-4S binding protein [Clostridium estertheticum]|uniref:4Fe-4S binding protein n=1 Tax=Clostridium estertheticum TaxID=238834 RepID=UPI001C0B811D|nr:4Fe-4S binding protein [Clostridium estertheticum]MBU3198366.1 4Fe-4S binding protein [Clostridium estertheticum]WAG65049.1 4Fe-4S binding protein [Clostridium estertheticum]
MITKDYLQMLQKEIHSTAFATVDENGLPQVRIIDIMLVDDNSLYFITAKGKKFYHQLKIQKFVAISGMTGGNGNSLTKKAISIRGKVRNVGQSLLDKIFDENPYMKEIYPTDARLALEVFQLYEGQGEYFDLSSKPIFRDDFTLGNTKLAKTAYVISKKCSGCGNCLKVCPQHCIDKGKPYSIRQQNCLYCGICFKGCPVEAIRLEII